MTFCLTLSGLIDSAGPPSHYSSETDGFQLRMSILHVIYLCLSSLDGHFDCGFSDYVLYIF